MTADAIADADTVVLVHGLWMTPRSWEHWIPRFERRGYRVIAPAYPGFEVEVEVEALREDPAPIEAVSVPDIVDHLEGIASELENEPPQGGRGPLREVRRPAPTTRSSRASTTTPWARPAGRWSPTTPIRGRPSTHPGASA
jgi:Alpha/beta hydrolase family